MTKGQIVDRDELAEMLTRAGFSTLEARGVRLFSDLVPSAFVDSDAERAALLELEEPDERSAERLF